MLDDIPLVWFFKEQTKEAARGVGGVLAIIALFLSVCMHKFLNIGIEQQIVLSDTLAHTHTYTDTYTHPFKHIRMRTSFNSTPR